MHTNGAIRGDNNNNDDDDEEDDDHDNKVDAVLHPFGVTVGYPCLGSDNYHTEGIGLFTICSSRIVSICTDKKSLRFECFGRYVNHKSSMRQKAGRLPSQSANQLVAVFTTASTH